jgi:TM2 domain-containing membrane protein YozV
MNSLRTVLVVLVLLAYAGELRAQDTTSTIEWTNRRITATVLSTLIPGSGQTYLGNPQKGALFTLASFGSALIAGLSENNVVGRNEHLEELKSNYAIVNNYVAADKIWNEIVETKSILDKEAKRRDIFLKIAIGLWIANVVDIVFFSRDLGERTFGQRQQAERPSVAIIPDPVKGIQAIVTIRF